MMALFEISTGECGEAFVRCYVWAQTETVAREMFKTSHPGKHIEDVNYVLDSREPPFVTGLSDSGFGERVK